MTLGTLLFIDFEQSAMQIPTCTIDIIVDAESTGNVSVVGVEVDSSLTADRN